LSTNPAATATIDSTSNPNTVTFTGEPGGTAVYYYPSTPVMALITYETATINDEPTYAFDTQFAYQYVNGAWEWLNTVAVVDSGADIWTGSDSQFYWGYTYRGLQNQNSYLFVVNYNPPDLVRYWDGLAWNILNIVTSPGNILLTARIVIPFKDRLLLLNTIEEVGTMVGTTEVTTGNFPATVLTPVPAVTYAVGQNFTIGYTTFTIINITPGAQALLSNGLATGTFDASTGTLTITGNGENPSTAIYLYSHVAAKIAIFVNRMRACQNGSPVDLNAWSEIPGKGIITEATTKEAIITSQFLKDRLIVYFESSSWELAYTGNEVLPFRWQQINTELGAESTFSTVPFDKVVLGIGNVGIHACNGSNVERIDDKIPTNVFEIANENEGVLRVYGIRDYFVEMVYWTFPSEENVFSDYPNKVLVYNYKTGAWALNDDSITAFGYFHNAIDVTWGGSDQLWENAEETWNSPTLQAQFRQVLAGNQEGFVFIIDSLDSRNAPALQITNMTAVANVVTFNVINHNFNENDYFIVENAQGVTSLNTFVFQVYLVIDANNFTVNLQSPPDPVFTGVYTGGGTIARISQINILTKQYNFYVQDGRNAFINKVDFLVNRTDSGQVTVDYFLSSSNISSLTDGAATGALVGTGMLETSPYPLIPLEEFQDRLWHPVYPMAEGECVQLQIYLNNAQLKSTPIAWSDFEMHAMTFFTSPTSSRLQ
jgi:hypothetical protein